MGVALLSAAVLWSGGRCLWVLQSQFQADGGPRLRIARATAAPQPEERYAVIGRRNLFRPPGPPEAAEREPEPVVVEKTRLDLSLIGTIFGAAGAESVAVVATARAPGGDVVQVGDRLADGRAEVVRIEQRRLILDHEGTLEALELDRSAGGDRRTVAARPPPAPVIGSANGLQLATEEMRALGWTQ